MSVQSFAIQPPVQDSAVTSRRRGVEQPPAHFAAQSLERVVSWNRNGDIPHFVVTIAEDAKISEPPGIVTAK